MSGFTALNVEPEDTFEEEIDDTKEIQVEEAFKLYQNALKLHSQGPDFYDAAEEAYNELFRSEVFKYPEAVTDYGHEQLDDGVALPASAGDQAPLPILPPNAADSAANSLPQLIYLSYKNRAQFILDIARHKLQEAPPDRKSACLHYYQYCSKSLSDSASALERDDTDLDLWKKAARISDVLSSPRLVRFCLESVVAGDDDTGEQTVDLSGLDEAFASGELLQVLKLIQDDVAVPRSAAMQPQSELLRTLQKSNDPYPYLPHRGRTAEHLYDNQRPNHFSVNQVEINLEGQNHTALADALAQSLGKGVEAAAEVDLGAFVTLSLPTSLERKLSSDVHVSNVSAIPDEKISNSQSASVQAGSPNESAPSPASYHSAPDEVKQDEEPNILTPAPKSNGDEASGTDTAVQDVERNEAQETIQSETRLPTRKRSSTAAGNEEPESRTKSKRLRARESLMEVAAQEEEMAHENDYQIREQLAIIADSDSSCLTYINKLLSKLEVPELATTQISGSQAHSDNEADAPLAETLGDPLMEDIRQAINSWTEHISHAVVHGPSFRDTIEKSGGMTLFQRHLKATLPRYTEQMDAENDDETIVSFARYVDQSKHTLADTAIAWLAQLLLSQQSSSGLIASYLRSAWPSEMRADIVYVLLKVDGILFDRIHQRTMLSDLFPVIESDDTLSPQRVPLPSVAELVQTIFEIHLDEYYSMTSPENRLDETCKAVQKDRMQRWATTSADIMQEYFRGESVSESDPLVLRFILASTLFTGLLAGDDKAHVLACLNDVRSALVKAGSPVINLPNNRAMPQVSIAAIDQEISRLSTLDFFNSVFEYDSSDPLALVMTIEPILEFAETSTEHSELEGQIDPSLRNRIIELRTFLDSGDASLKLFLWRRLQHGYATIGYKPKFISCLLRSLETIVHEVRSRRHKFPRPLDRQIAIFWWLRDADEIMTKILSKISDDAKPFECLDEDHLRSSLSAVAATLDLLYEFVKYDDSLRLGQTPLPTMRTNSIAKSFEKSRDKLRDTFVRGWTLMYYLLKEATIQFPQHFEQPLDQLAEYIRLVHNILGHRQYCKQAGKIFVKLAKNELLSTRSEIDYSEDIAQILYDMYQIRLGVGFGDANHGCTGDSLGRDKDTAFNLVPVIMSYARKLNMRELIKSELKGTVDKIQQTLGQVKPTAALSFNRKAVSTFLKSPVNPQEVYRSLKGIGDLITRPVYGEYAKIASQGWYQLLGRISLAKYKAIKRVNPTPTDDLDTAGTFLRLDLEHNINDWETWYRLAQVFDSKIEDSLIWNSLKINDSRGEIALLERNAINAYTMAVAMAMRNANDSIDTVQKISDMFSEFAFRLYASSRPPLHMEAFSTDKHMRHLSNSQDSSMSKAPFIIPFREYPLWGFASYLLQRKFATGQKEWLCYYTLGKCLWKMYQHPDNAKAKKPITVEDVLDAFTDAVELVPRKEKAAEYILEPHYKLVSIVHKLVNRKLISPAHGSKHLQTTQFARTVHLSRDEQESEWDTYVLEILRKIGHADKSNWHHRITARAAHINYDDNPTIAGALGAKHQFTQQVFTKTMTMQVWKPEYERPGRHYVYTGRYLSFFVHLLDRLNDRGSLEQLVRRIRRKTTDFLDHPKVWEETAMTYVKLLRRIGKIPDGKERSLFDKISFEEFSKMSERVEKWAHDPENASIVQEVMQDAIELKKLNNSLMKGPAIDDLIGDSYACLYEAFVSQLPPAEVAPPIAAALPQGTFINMNTDIVPTGDDNLDRMRLNNLLSAQTDGAPSGLTPGATFMGLGLTTPSAGTPPTEPVRIPTPSKPGRTKTITRREVQRKAEGCIVKPPPIKTPTLLKRPFIDLPGRRDSTATNLQDEADDKSHLDDEMQDGSRMCSRQPSVSARGSAEPEDANRDADGEGGDDDDGEADDESELTDLENEEEDDDPKDDRHVGTLIPSTSDRKRKAGDTDGKDEESAGEERDEEQDEEAHDGNEVEADESGADMGKDEMNVDEPEDEDVLEIQDSQEPIVHTEPVQEISTQRPKRTRESTSRKVQK